MGATFVVNTLFPRCADFNAFASKRATIPFDDNVIESLNALSSAILKDKRSRQYPDVITFAFFIRKTNLLALKSNYQPSVVNCRLRLGRGLVFHIAPSNVPVNFGYSMVAGLLAGNNNIVRVSSKDFPQVNLIVEQMNNVYESGIANELDKVVLIKYDHSDTSITDYFSYICNARVIWGGDNTIANIRKSPIASRAIDICFADRYSIAAINADKLVEESDIYKVANGFYNDTYLFDQNACSAPHLVIWTGTEENIQKAKAMFWRTLHSIVVEKYQFQSVMAVDKQTALYRQAVAMDVKSVDTDDNLVRRVELDLLSENVDDYRCTCGYFTEYVASSIDELDKIIKNKYQTLAYYGYSNDELKSFVLNNKLRGIDRVVPIGTTTYFDLEWDGYNLIDALSRVVNVC